MKPIPFNSRKDLPPVLFDTETCRLATEIKRLGIPWQPHVGCFVWDPHKHIKAESPFPHRIYFILSLPRFIDLFGSIEAIAEKLVWLPTWHQARLLCQQLGVPDEAVADIWQSHPPRLAGDELRQIYALLMGALKK
ncbi:MAG: hypothetical protein OET21_07820 [Desulfobacterales bacterium]|jgi:hypothetical protein|nr:hypothetical protein [Desulfobacterales bacterium]MDH3827306.1 hypothetical protein [Desulfobacterales bacterium]MDH3877758.1 hypothetical protein [Desulfobacterales bacterium]MDH4009892.1 hypothetical protein [Desulfobacterales bacterium]